MTTHRTAHGLDTAKISESASAAVVIGHVEHCRAAPELDLRALVMPEHGTDDQLHRVGFPDPVPVAATQGEALQHRTTRHLHLHVVEVFLHRRLESLNTSLVTNPLAQVAVNVQVEKNNASPALHTSVPRMMQHRSTDELNATLLLDFFACQGAQDKPLHHVASPALNIHVCSVFLHCSEHQHQSFDFRDVLAPFVSDGQFLKNCACQLLQLRVTGVL
mmetsp:Transcript_30932/g.82112  ORF Transcript_30932/g.82112 Transcript_30932/m.82112 type:complete len:218 (+) Transcript_30932:319-972(+)